MVAVGFTPAGPWQELGGSADGAVEAPQPALIKHLTLMQVET